jgi:ammonia channel protein AmtB
MRPWICVAFSAPVAAAAAVFILWGTIACAIFDWGVPNGNYHGWGGFSPTEGASMLGGLGANLAEIGAIIVWSGGCIFILFSSLKKMGFLRIPVEAEEVGLDDHEFSPKRGYTTFEVGACSPKPQAPKTQTVVPQPEVQGQ